MSHCDSFLHIGRLQQIAVQILSEWQELLENLWNGSVLPMDIEIEIRVLGWRASWMQLGKKYLKHSMDLSWAFMNCLSTLFIFIDILWQQPFLKITCHMHCMIVHWAGGLGAAFSGCLDLCICQDLFHVFWVFSFAFTRVSVNTTWVWKVSVYLLNKKIS